MRAGNAPPRLAPSTTVRASGTGSRPVSASDTASSTIARLEWTSQVRHAASSTTSTRSSTSEASTSCMTTESRNGCVAATMS